MSKATYRGLQMGLSVKVIKNDLPQMPAKIEDRLDQVVRKAAIDLQGWMGVLIGQVGAVDTGNLLNSIATDIVGHAHAFVGTAVEYAPYVEYGTVHMPARPWAFPAAQRVRPELTAAAKQLMGGL